MNIVSSHIHHLNLNQWSNLIARHAHAVNPQPPHIIATATRLMAMPRRPAAVVDARPGPAGLRMGGCGGAAADCERDAAEPLRAGPGVAASGEGR